MDDRGRALSRHERLSALLELLAERESVSVEVTARELYVSPATVRRDMDHLAQQHMLVRTHGGAAVSNAASTPLLQYKTGRHADRNQRIAAAAARLVRPGMVVGLNGGTTTTEAARAIATRETEGVGVTVVTNALNIAAELVVRSHIRVVVTGGVARPQSYELLGDLAGRVLDELSIDLMLLGVDALDPDRGAAAHHEGEASTNRMMTDRAHRVVVLADSSKLLKSAFARICRTSRIDTLITDTSADDAAVKSFQGRGVSVVRA
jgi:DeoR family transcriptional regulator, aga operon transcriptional repressor